MADTVLETLVTRLTTDNVGLRKGYVEAIQSTQSAASSMTALMSQASAQIGAGSTRTAALFQDMGKVIQQTASEVVTTFVPMGEKVRTALLSVGNVAGDVSKNLGTMLSGGVFDFAKGVGGLASNAAMAIPSLQGVAAAINTWVPALERAVGGMTGFYKAGAAASESMRKMALTTGLSVPAVAGLQHAANLAGFDVDELSAGIAGLNRHLGQALNPSSEAARGLRALGLDAHEIATMNVDEAVGKIGDALNKVSNPAERAALAFGAFGRRGIGLQGIAAKGSEFFERARKDAELLGNALSAVDIGRIKKAQDASKELKAVGGASLGNLQKSFAASFAPTAASVQMGLSGFIRALTPVFQVVQQIFRVAGGIADIFVNIADVVGRAIAPAFNAIMDVVKSIGKALGGLVSVIGEVAGAIKTYLVPVFEFLGEAIALPVKSIGGLSQLAREVAGLDKLVGVKQLKDIKGKGDREREIARRGEAIEAMPRTSNTAIGQTFERVQQEGARQELQRQIAEANKAQAALNLAQIAEARGKIEDQVDALNRQGAALGKTAAESMKYAAIQDLVKTTGMNAAEAEEKLGNSLNQLAAAQTRLTVEQAVQSVKDQTKAIDQNTATVGMNAAESARYVAVHELMKATNATEADATAVLTRALDRQAAAMQRQIVAESTKKLDDQTRAIRVQTAALGLSADEAARYTAVSELMHQTGMGEAEARRQLADALDRQGAAMRKQAVGEALQKTRDATRALEVQIGTLGMTSEAASKYTTIMELAKKANISVEEAARRLGGALDEQGRLQVALDAGKLTQQWHEQALTLGMTAEATERYKLAVRGATAEQLRALDASAALKQAAESDKVIKETAERLTEEMRTPMEIFDDRVNELNELLTRGAITWEVYSRAIEKAAGQANQLNRELHAVQGAAAGSAEAVSRINAYQASLVAGPLHRNALTGPVQGRAAGAVDLGALGAPPAGGKGPNILPADFKPPVLPVEPGPRLPVQPNQPGGGLDDKSPVLTVLREIRDLLAEKGKKPGLEIRPAGLS